MIPSAQREWATTKDALNKEICKLGFPEELGNAVAQNLGSPKAMQRMISYLKAVKPRRAELVVDEMLAICSEIEEWRKKKESQQANAKYNDMLANGLRSE